jgi:hypothetical protein
MSEILHANIFFFIASIATIAFAIMGCIAMYHVIKILKSLRTLMEKIEDGSDMIAEDITTMRDFVFKGGMISHLMRLVVGTSARKNSTRARKSTRDIVITDKE